MTATDPTIGSHGQDNSAASAATGSEKEMSHLTKEEMDVLRKALSFHILDEELTCAAARIAELESRERALREALRLTQRTWQESFDAAAYSVQVTRHEMKNIQAALRGGGDQR